MDKVFEPSEMEIDIQSDPNRVIEIQGKVKELLEANRQRQEGIRQELVDKGAWALPGLINSTYVWMNNVEGDKTIQKKLSDLMAELATGNEAAENLLAKAGVLENPFEIPRSIARLALEKLNWKPGKEILKHIKKEIKRQNKLENIPWVLDLYKLLLLSGSESELSGALDYFKRLMEMNLTSSNGQLLAIIIQSYPNHVEKILTECIMATQKDYNNKDIANMLVKPLQPIPTEWLSKNILVRVSSKVLSACDPPRHTVIEFLWIDAAQDCMRNSPELWAQQVNKTGEAIQTIGKKVPEKTAESLYRYWFQAIANAGEIQAVIKAAFSDAELWGAAAALQLFFGKKNQNPQIKTTVAQALKDLKVQKEWRHDHAMNKFKDMSSKKKSGSEIRSAPKAGALKVRS